MADKRSTPFLTGKDSFFCQHIQSPFAGDLAHMKKVGQTAFRRNLITWFIDTIFDVLLERLIYFQV